MSAVFISYRRDDSAGHTGRLYDHLLKEFGKEYVFRDIDTIEPGTDFVDAVEDGIKDCSTLLVVIGNEWLTAEDEMGRRLDEPNDFVRIEVASALKKKLRVIPVLVQGAKMPNASELPEDLAPLARRHALELSDSRWDYDMGRLINSLSPSIAKPDNTKEKQLEPDDIIHSDDKTGAETVEQHDTLRTEQEDKYTGKEKTGNTTTKIFGTGIVLLLAIVIWQYFLNNKPKAVVHENTEAVSIESRNVTDTEIVPDSEIKELDTSKIPAPDNNDITIAELLSAAKNDLSALRLTTPAGNNALEKYNSILELEPGHDGAMNGLRSIADKYISLAESALHGGNLANADNYLNQAKSVYPQANGIAAIRKKINEQQLSIERQQAERTAEIERQQAEREAETQRRQAEREAQIAREREAEKQALLSREKIQSCVHQCEQQYENCMNTPQPIDNDCEGKVKAECETVQNLCLGDPQTTMLWGDIGAESECLGRWNQCMRQKTRECEEVSVRHTEDCEGVFSSCRHECQ